MVDQRVLAGLELFVGPPEMHDTRELKRRRE
jgi:hypothetical protein